MACNIALDADEAKRRICDLAAKVGEHFPDYIICGRTKDAFIYINSDTTWARGVIHRLAVISDQADAASVETEGK